MLEVFKTNVQEADKANELLNLLQRHFPGIRINFDLDDCDKVLRLEGAAFCINEVIRLVTKNGYECMVLE